MTTEQESKVIMQYAGELEKRKNSLENIEKKSEIRDTHEGRAGSKE